MIFTNLCDLLFVENTLQHLVILNEIMLEFCIEQNLLQRNLALPSQ
jgi:hypothetical protein